MNWYTLEETTRPLSFLAPISRGGGGGQHLFPLTLDPSFDGLHHHELNTQELFSFVKMIEIQNVMMKAKLTPLQFILPETISCSDSCCT